MIFGFSILTPREAQCSLLLNSNSYSKSNYYYHFYYYSYLQDTLYLEDFESKRTHVEAAH